MKFGLKLAVWIAVALIVMVIGNFGLALLNEPSDVAVTGGVIILLAILVGAVALGGYLKKKYHSQPPKDGQGESDMSRTVRSLFLFIAVAFIAATSTGCSEVVEPGHVGIRVNKTGSDRGVSSYPIVTGRVFYNPLTTDILQYPTFVQTVVWTKDPTEGSKNNEEISFNSKESLEIKADISVSYQIDPSKVPAFYVKFRSESLENFTGTFLRNATRDAFTEVASKLPVEEILGEKKEDLRSTVHQKLNKQLSEIGIHLEQFGFVGAMRPPQNVVNAINAKIASTQAAMQSENELRQAEAEAKKKVAAAEGEARSKVALAQGDAEANKILSSSINENLIKWRSLDLTQQAIAKWNGVRPSVEGSGSGLLLSLPVPQK